MSKSYQDQSYEYVFLHYDPNIQRICIPCTEIKRWVSTPGNQDWKYQSRWGLIIWFSYLFLAKLWVLL